MPERSSNGPPELVSTGGAAIDAADDLLARAKPLPRRLPIAGEPPELVPARMINEVLYCERLMYLEWAQGEFADNVFTVDGRAVHARADVPRARSRRVRSPTRPRSPTRGRPAPTAANVEDGEDDPRIPPPYVARSFWLSSTRLGLTAKIDVVEGAGDRRASCRSSTSAAPRPTCPEGAYLPERAQLCAQVMLLREHGYACDHGEIYFARIAPARARS